jgi:hypothetical protein
MPVNNVNELAEAIVMFTLLPSITVIDKADNFVVDKNGAKPILVHEDNNEYVVMWVDDEFWTIKDFKANTPEKVIKIAYNWCIENKLISIN